MRRSHSPRSILLGTALALAFAGCAGGGPTVGQSGAELTQAQCDYFAVDGKVTICHHTGSAKKPYNLITINVNGCHGHDGHAGDYIAVDDPTCNGQGCFPAGAPYDGTVECCAGLAPQGGVCADIDECAAGTDDCGDHATCTNTVGSFTCACDPGYGGDGHTCNPVCGDGLVAGGEQCDDGNTVSGDGCSATCTVEATCGDGVVGPGETCDDGNTAAGDGCSPVCRWEPCAMVDLPVIGGNGGGAFRDVCPCGFWATGFTGVTRSYAIGFSAVISHFSLTCTNQVTPQRGTFGGDDFTATCGAGRALTGQTIGRNGFVSSMEGTCRTIGDVVGGSHGVPTSTGTFQSPVGVGASQGTFHAECPPGFVVVGVHGASGEVLDSVGFVCRIF